LKLLLPNPKARLLFRGELTLVGDERHLPYDRPPFWQLKVLYQEWLNAIPQFQSKKTRRRISTRAS
jgi:hypothetical protein